MNVTQAVGVAGILLRGALRCIASLSGLGARKSVAWGGSWVFFFLEMAYSGSFLLNSAWQQGLKPVYVNVYVSGRTNC